MSKIKVVAIVGDSGSGKTHAAMYLEEKFGWKAIVSYTTRPMREGEMQGREHWFVDSTKGLSEDKMCAYTRFGNYEYWTEWNQFPENRHCAYVIDEKGLIDLMTKKNVPVNIHLTTIRIKRQDKTGIDAGRMDRDRGRVNLPDNFFDYIVNNDSNLEDFHKLLDWTAESIIDSRNKKSQKRILAGFQLLNEYDFWPDWPDKFDGWMVFATSEDAEKYRQENLEEKDWRIEPVWAKSETQRKKYRIFHLNN